MTWYSSKVIKWCRLVLILLLLMVTKWFGESESGWLNRATTTDACVAAEAGLNRCCEGSNINTSTWSKAPGTTCCTTLLVSYVCGSQIDGRVNEGPRNKQLCSYYSCSALSPITVHHLISKGTRTAPRQRYENVHSSQLKGKQRWTRARDHQHVWRNSFFPSGGDYPGSHSEEAALDESHGGTGPYLDRPSMARSQNYQLAFKIICCAAALITRPAKRGCFNSQSRLTFLCKMNQLIPATRVRAFDALSGLKTLICIKTILNHLT